MSPQNLTQNPQNPSGSGARDGFEYFEDDFRRIETLLGDLRSADVHLRIEGGRLAFDAPAGAMTEDLLARVRADRAGLMRILSGVGDPVAVRPTPDDPTPSDRAPPIRCPACGGIELADDPGGLRCRSCRSIAWVATAEGGLARRDLVEEGILLIDPEDVPICPGCGRWCDVLTLAEAWRCHRCDPDADDRRRLTSKLLGSVSRSLGRCVRGVRGGS